jgi:hypothetical protein
VATPTPACSDNWLTVMRVKARAARICSLVITSK